MLHWLALDEWLEHIRTIRTPTIFAGKAASIGSVPRVATRPARLGDLHVSDVTFEEVLEGARTDERVIGLFLGGSRGKDANVRPTSDYDVRVVGDATDFETARGSAVEVAVMTLDRFRDYPEWDRYTLTHTRALIDRTG